MLTEKVEEGDVNDLKWFILLNSVHGVMCGGGHHPHVATAPWTEYIWTYRNQEGGGNISQPGGGGGGTHVGPYHNIPNFWYPLRNK